MTRTELVIKVRDGLLRNLASGDSSAAEYLLLLLDTYPYSGLTHDPASGKPDAPLPDVSPAKYGSAS